MPAMATAMMLSITTGEGNTTPRWSRGRTSDLEAESTGRALALAGGAQAAQPTDQQRVGLEGLGTVDQGVEDLVVAGGGHVELLPDGRLLGPGVLPPLALELEDLAVPVAQARRRPGVAAVQGVRGIHALSPLVHRGASSSTDGRASVYRGRTTSMSFRPGESRDPKVTGWTRSDGASSRPARSRTAS